MRSVVIDARKITHSGIGRYLRNLLPGVVAGLHAERILLLGRKEELSEIAASDRRCSLLESEAAPHSLREQQLALWPELRRTSLLWVPHYNIPLLYRGPLVTTLHDLAPLDLPETFNHPAKRLLAEFLLRQCARRSRAILTPSCFSRNRILDRLRVSPGRVSVTPLAVDRAWPALADAPPSFAATKPYLLFVGNLKPNKNLSAALEALRLLGPGYPLRLLVAGRVEGFRTADRRAAATAAALAGRVEFLGNVPDAQLIALYRGAAALVVPSLYEGFGLPVLEAMRYGCPVLGSASSSLGEVAGDSAILVDPRDTAALAEGMRKILDPQVSLHLRTAGFARERLFTYDGAIQTTAQILNACLEVAA